MQADIIETKAEYAFIYDFDTKSILYQKNANKMMPPASMSKLMTVYLVFDKLKNNELKLDDEFAISQKAFERRGSSMFAQLKSRVSVDNLLQGVIVVSGNDASIALAEGIGGDEDSFAKQLQKKSREIGLTQSTFVNSTGWPNENQLMTAHDLGQLAYRLILDFPEYYHYFSQRRFVWQKVDQPNRNLLLDDETGVDGLKTGHTKESGHGIVTSAKINDRRIIIVLNGLKTSRERAAETRKLLNWAFTAFKKYKLFSKGAVIGEAKIAGGVVDRVGFQVKQDFVATLNIDMADDIQGKISYLSPLIAPIKKNQHIADLYINGKSGFNTVIPLYAEKHVAKGKRVDEAIDILWSWGDKKFQSLF